MKKFLIFTICSLSFWSCNENIDLIPAEPKTKQFVVPDFNFIATAPYDFVYPNPKQMYVLPIELYLRPFEGVHDTTSFIFEFGSTQYAQLLILKDTLYPGDKKRIQYSDFNKFRLIPTYQSVITGEHALTFSVTSSGIKKNSTLKISAKN